MHLSPADQGDTLPGLCLRLLLARGLVGGRTRGKWGLSALGLLPRHRTLVCPRRPTRSAPLWPGSRRSGGSKALSLDLEGSPTCKCRSGEGAGRKALPNGRETPAPLPELARACYRVPFVTNSPSWLMSQPAGGAPGHVPACVLLAAEPSRPRVPGRPPSGRGHTPGRGRRTPHEAAPTGNKQAVGGPARRQGRGPPGARGRPAGNAPRAGREAKPSTEAAAPAPGPRDKEGCLAGGLIRGCSVGTAPSRASGDPTATPDIRAARAVGSSVRPHTKYHLRSNNRKPVRRSRPSSACRWPRAPAGHLPVSPKGTFNHTGSQLIQKGHTGVAGNTPTPCLPVPRDRPRADPANRYSFGVSPPTRASSPSPCSTLLFVSQKMLSARDARGAAERVPGAPRAGVRRWAVAHAQAHAHARAHMRRRFAAGERAPRGFCAPQPASLPRARGLH